MFEYFGLYAVPCCRIVENSAEDLIRIPVEYDATEIKDNIQCWNARFYCASAT